MKEGRENNGLMDVRCDGRCVDGILVITCNVNEQQGRRASLSGSLTVSMSVHSVVVASSLARSRDAFAFVVYCSSAIS